MNIEVLAPGHDRSNFSCGNDHLDRYFREQAAQHQRKFVSQTYVGVIDAQVIGYATVGVGTVRSSETGDLLRKMPSSPLPVLILYRLGIQKQHHGAGLGNKFFVHICRIVLELKDAVGCVGVLVDSKPTALSWYMRYGFHHLEDRDDGGVRLMLLTSEIAVATEAVGAAAGSAP